MPAPLRIVVAAAVLTAGLACAALFRRDGQDPPQSTGSHPVAPPAGTVEVGRHPLRETIQPPPGNPLGDRVSPFRFAPYPSSGDGANTPGPVPPVAEPAPPKSAQPSDPPEASPGPSRAAPSIPSMAPKFPGSGILRPNRVGDLPPTSATRPDRRTHHVVDGDTLESIAERYLGSAQRAGVIRQANSERLPDPNVLPIGIELVIPDLPADSATLGPPALSSAPNEHSPARPGETNQSVPGPIGGGESVSNRFERAAPQRTNETGARPAAIVWPSSNARGEKESRPAADGWEPAAR